MTALCRRASSLATFSGASLLALVLLAGSACAGPAGPHGRGRTGPSEALGHGHACSRPVFSSSAPFGIWSQHGYNVYNNMWAEANPPPTGPGSQKLYVCNYNSWYVMADMPLPGQPTDSVKTYPNVQENFSSVPVHRFSKLASTFAEHSPPIGDYEDAFDMWLNGVASAGSNEVMIWNDNHGQRPAGSPEATADFGGVRYTVWRTSNSGYIAFVAQHNFTSGTLDILSFYDWLIARGWLPSKTVVDQIDYGAEICSTGSAPAQFDFTDFSINPRY